MGARAIPLVIDARPQGAFGPLAAEQVLGRSVLGHLMDLAAQIVAPNEPVIVHARTQDQQKLCEISDFVHRREVVLDCGPPRPDAAILRTDRFYDARRLRRLLRAGRPAESAALWRLDRPEALRTANEELSRRLTYQPLGKYWAFPLARRLAQVLQPTIVRPNAITLAAGALMLGAAGLVAAGADALSGRLAIALALALALVLDTADGRLARLQGTCSAFGRWLDQVLDELADLALHAAIAWAAFVRDGHPAWLVFGIFFASGKYLFLVQSLTGSELDAPAGEGARDGSSPARLAGVLSRGSVLGHGTQLVRLLGHADLRWHLWIALALVGRLELALAFYAVYFPARALAGIVKKGVRHA
jgi:phosphatidylglycerophosphate synthase